MRSIIRIRADEGKLTLAPYTVCRILEGGLKGFESPPELKCEVVPSAFGDGGVVVKYDCVPRELSIHFEVTDRGEYRSVRDQILKIMSSRREVNITADLFGRRRSIGAYPAGKAEFIRENVNSFPEVRLHFVCPEPYFTENKTEALTLPSSEGLFTFPLNVMEEAGFVPSFASVGTVHKIYNPGDVPCGFSVKVSAVGGNVTDPALLLNGKRLQLMETLKIGDVAVFDTRRGKCGVSVNGVVRYNFSRESNFFSLEPGENRLTVMSVGDTKNLLAEICFTPYYAGV
ncbi:MAG: phage tail family protein [Clostridia bacterium]|nr:phage tail family protein [Clostridia bacterium]